MPTFPGKDGNPRFSMNPQVGAAMNSGTAPGLPGADPTDPDAGGGDDHVELHHGGHPQGDPPPHEGTQYHTIHTKDPMSPPEIKNHDDYSSADQHMQECMGEGGMDGMDGMGMSSEDSGGDSGDE